MSSPKQRFQESKENMSFWSDLVTKATFIRGLDVSLLQLRQKFPPTDHTETAAANFQRISGAEMLRDILIGLPEIAKEKAPLPDMNLLSPSAYNTGRGLKQT